MARKAEFGQKEASLSSGAVAQQEEWDPMHYGHPRMPLSERAKIFMPFDPLKGFRAELRRREERMAERGEG